MDIINPFDAPAFVNHLPLPVRNDYVPDPSRRTGSSRFPMEGTSRFNLEFPRELWVQSWAVAPF